MNYGLPYMGSKSKIVKHIVPLFHKAKTFVDLFAGGGAITHYLMTTRKYHHFIFNDINPLMPKAFEMALNGEFEKETRWISREDFFRLRDTDPYAAICFSFGNNLSTYMYNEEIEPIKEAYHYAIFFRRLQPCKRANGDRPHAVGKMPYNQGGIRYVEAYCQDYPYISRNKVTVMERQERIWRIWNASQGAVAIRECGEDLVVRKVAAAISGHNANVSPQLPLSDVIEFYSTDYQAVPIPENSVIYCDIPYKGTGLAIPLPECLNYDAAYLEGDFVKSIKK